MWGPGARAVVLDVLGGEVQGDTTRLRLGELAAGESRSLSLWVEGEGARTSVDVTVRAIAAGVAAEQRLEIEVPIGSGAGTLGAEAEALEARWADVLWPAAAATVTRVEGEVVALLAEDEHERRLAGVRLGRQLTDELRWAGPTASRVLARTKDLALDAVVYRLEGNRARPPPTPAELEAERREYEAQRAFWLSRPPFGAGLDAGLGPEGVTELGRLLDEEMAGEGR